jgi:uncharacterized protein (TIGR03067 family)
MRLLVVASLVSAVFFSNSASALSQPGDAKSITAEELDKLPDGIKVVHEPNVALATLTGKSERRLKYTWWYKTTVSARTGDVTILEFGALSWQDDQWVAGATITGKPYTANEFADWYKCPKAALKKGKSYSDPTNWSTDQELRAGKIRWYYLGIDDKGRRVKGEAVIELKAEIDPKKPKDVEPAGGASRPPEPSGTWSVVSSEQHGKPFKYPAKGTLFTFHEGKVLGGPKKAEGKLLYTFTTDSKKDPKQIDLLHEVENKQVRLRGIYRIEEDRLVICIGVASGAGDGKAVESERPSEFRSGPKVQLITFAPGGN